jgi:hypothetical protein
MQSAAASIILGFVSHVEPVWDEMQAVRVEAGRYLAAAIGGARLVKLDGDDHWLWVGDQRSIIAATGAFVAGLQSVAR